MRDDDLELGATLDAGTPTPRSGEPAPEARLGSRYKLTRLLGKGGMGSVFLAVDEVLDGEVALKFVSPELPSGSLDRLRDEVRHAQRVTHRNVCRTYDLEEIDGRYVVKMEFVAGETLGRRLARDGRLAVPAALAIARQIADGLAAAHAAGIIHRDLKPDNVMLEESGRAVIMDFGLALRSVPDDDLSTVLAGTPGFMAPEQVMARPLDARADLYALGCVLHYMLTREVPFPPGGSKRRPLPPETPAWLDHLVERLLADDREARPASAEEVRRALDGPRRRRWPIALAAAVLGLGGGALIWKLTRPPPPWRPAIRELPAYEEAAEAAVFSPDGTQIAYASDRDGSGFLRVWVEPLDGGRSRPLTGPAESFHYPFWLFDGESLVAVTGPPAMNYRIAVADGARAPLLPGGRAVPCGRQLLLREDFAPGCSGCSRLVLPGPPEQELVRFAAGERVEHFRCDSRGEQVTYSLGPGDSPSVRDVWLLAAGGAPRRITDDGFANTSPTFTPDGRTVVFSSARAGTVDLWEAPVAGGAPRRITRGPGAADAPDVSPDGRWLLFHVSHAVPVVLAYPASGPQRRLECSGEDCSVQAVTSDGAEVIVTQHRDDGDVVVAVSTRDGEQRVIGAGQAAALTVDERELLIADGAELRAAPLAGGETRTIAALPGRVTRIASAPDGVAHLAVAAGDDLEAWAVAPGDEPRRDAGGYARVAPAPQGDWLAASMLVPRRELHLFRPGTAPGSGDPAAVLPFGDTFAWAPDGASLVYWNRRELRRYAVATADDQRLFERGALDGLAIAADGTIFLGDRVTRVERKIITNFADR